MCNIRLLLRVWCVIIMIDQWCIWNWKDGRQKHEMWLAQQLCLARGIYYTYLSQNLWPFRCNLGGLIGGYPPPPSTSQQIFSSKRPLNGPLWSIPNFFYVRILISWQNLIDQLLLSTCPFTTICNFTHE